MMKPSGVIMPKAARVIPVNRCENCKWSEQVSGGKLECHRHPPHPTVFPVHGQGGMPSFAVHTAWPVVTAVQWCGEYSLRAVAK